MQVYPEVMEPLFHYEGHGAANVVAIPNLPQVLEVDVFNRIGTAPCLNNPAYRTWWHAIIEDYCRSYDIDGVMWCNERRSPLDNLISGNPPNCFCQHCCRLADQRGIGPAALRDAERAEQRGKRPPGAAPTFSGRVPHLTQRRGRGA